MKSNRLRIQLMAAAAVAGMAMLPGVSGAGFTSAQHRPRRRQAQPQPTTDPNYNHAIALWNHAVDQRNWAKGKKRR